MERRELLKQLELSCYIAFDFETTGLDPNHDRIIEVAAIKFREGEISDRYVQLINPNIDIPELITDITGITNSMVQSKPTEESIVDDLLAFIGNYPLVAHNINFDNNFLTKLCQRWSRDPQSNSKYDTLQLARSVLFEQPVFNLGALSEYYNLPLEGAHRAENDTKNTGLIFLELIEEVSKYPIEIISKINGMIKGTSIPNQKLYVDLGNFLIKKGEIKRGVSNFSNSKDLSSNTLFCDGSSSIANIHAKEVFGASGLLSKIHPNFEHRASQEKYAEVVDHTLNIEPGIGVFEAGTGLGKSMSYLFGAIRRSTNFEEEGPTIIACNTKHLQDQLFYKDLPTILKALDVPLKAVLLKGRKNYICKTRFKWLISEPKTLDRADLEAIIPLIFWMYWTKTGDMSECSGFFNARREWLRSSVNSDSGFCTGDICSGNDGCYYGKLRKAAYYAEVIVINHSLLMADIVQKGLLPDYKSVIIDEAHNLTKSAYDQFRVEWSEQQVLYNLQNLDPSFSRSARWNNIINSIGEKTPDLIGLRDELKREVLKAKDHLNILMERLREEKQHSFNSDKSYQEQLILRNISKEYAPIKTEINSMRDAMESMMRITSSLKKATLELDSDRSKYPILHASLDRGLEIIVGLIDSLIMLTGDQDPEWVYWIDGEFKYGTHKKDALALSLFMVMVDISSILRRKFFEKLESCVLTSATLQVHNSFDYYSRRTGIDEMGNAKKKEFLSPFHYSEQVSYYQYAGPREISNDPKSIGDIIYDIHTNSHKRMMVLFTSVRILTETAKYLRNKQNGRDLPLFAQVKGASRPSILRGMYQKSDGILFGTNSFWEGIDLPGDLLEILVMVKLPFDVPSDPLVKSYAEYINKMGGNSFLDYTIPEAAIKFRQGFGRLIRTSYDAGKFVCLDNRIVVKRYGSLLSESLPVDMQTFTNAESII